MEPDSGRNRIRDPYTDVPGIPPRNEAGVGPSFNVWQYTIGSGLVIFSIFKVVQSIYSYCPDAHPKHGHRFGRHTQTTRALSRIARTIIFVQKSYFDVDLHRISSAIPCRPTAEFVPDFPRHESPPKLTGLAGSASLRNELSRASP